MADTVCRICKNKKNNKIHTVKEMFFGTRESFEYIECGNCGCLQIKKYPQDLAKYYPENYGAHKAKNISRSKPVIEYLRNQRLSYVMDNKKSINGFLLNLLIKPDFESKLLPAKVMSTSSILDVGSGAGTLILNLRNKGFKDITGIDKFIKEDIIYDTNLRIYKKEISEVKGQFDFIMMNHSFEHMPDQDEVMTHLKRLIKPSKYIMIRVPVKTDYIWNKYGVNWGQIDAPRHFYLHTEKSMQIIAERHNFTIEKILYDSEKFQFYSSEQYAKDIPLRDERSYYMNPDNSVFSKNEIRNFEKKSRELNKNGQGDSACFYLRQR